MYLFFARHPANGFIFGNLGVFGHCPLGVVLDFLKISDGDNYPPGLSEQFLQDVGLSSLIRGKSITD